MKTDIEFIGQRFGRLIPRKYVGNYSYECDCDCGGKVVVRKYSLIAGTTASCGCLLKEYQANSPRTANVLGKRFGLLEPYEAAGKNKRREMTWRCRCDCGNTRVVSGTHLLTGYVTSCGCADKKKAVDAPCDGTKICNECKVAKPLADFHISTRSWAGHSGRCRDCSNKNKGRNWLKWRYGITQEQYDSMWESQHGKCAVCLKPSKKLFVDHCHTSKKVRGLLCNGCNAAIGMFGENLETMLRAIEYLKANELSPTHNQTGGLDLSQPIHLTNERN